MGLCCAVNHHLPDESASASMLHESCGPQVTFEGAVFHLPGLVVCSGLSVHKTAVAGLGVVVLSGTMASMCWAVPK